MNAVSLRAHVRQRCGCGRLHLARRAFLSGGRANAVVNGGVSRVACTVVWIAHRITSTLAPRVHPGVPGELRRSMRKYFAVNAQQVFELGRPYTLLTSVFLPVSHGQLLMSWLALRSLGLPLARKIGAKRSVSLSLHNSTCDPPGRTFYSRVDVCCVRQAPVFLPEICSFLAERQRMLHGTACHRQFPRTVRQRRARGQLRHGRAATLGIAARHNYVWVRGGESAR